MDHRLSVGEIIYQRGNHHPLSQSVRLLEPSGGYQVCRLCVLQYYTGSTNGRARCHVDWDAQEFIIVQSHSQRRESYQKERSGAQANGENGYITEQQYDSLRVLPLGIDFQKISHTEGMAPYFREVLRGKIQELFEEKMKTAS